MIENPRQDIKYIDSIVINSEFLLEKLTQSHTCWSWCGNCNYVVHKKSDISHILLFWRVSRDTRLVKQWESVWESGHCRKTVVRYCWNSLIVHQVKTKKTTSVKEVWICGLNYSLVLFWLRRMIYQTLKTVFHRLSKHLKFRQKYSAAHRIWLCSQCLDIPMKLCLLCLI